MTTNGRAELKVLEDYQSRLLRATQEITEATVEFGKGYGQAAEGLIRLSFANLKVLTTITAVKQE